MFNLLVRMLLISTLTMAFVAGIIFIVNGHTPMVDHMCLMLFCLVVSCFCAFPFVTSDEEE